MRRALKWIGIGLGVIIGLLIVAVIVFYFMGSARLTKTYDIEAESVTIPSDEESLARGEYIVRRICVECHRGNLGGSVSDDIFIDEPGLFTIYAANITPGEGGIGELSDADLVRAIRHGIDQDDSHLIVMPAEIFIHMSAEDLGSVIAFLRTLPPVDNVVPEPQISFIARALAGADMIGSVFPAEYIDHDMPFPDMPEISVNAEYGEYLVSAFACTLCHGDDMVGGIIPPNAPPGEWPLAPNITLGGETSGWSDDDFLETIRTGVAPDGNEIDEPMPMSIYTQLSDEDILAIWEYIKTVPPVENPSE
jgi:mono/diheme cytochrome c family protein